MNRMLTAWTMKLYIRCKMSKKYEVKTRTGIAMVSTAGHQKTGRALKRAFLWACGDLMEDFNIVVSGNDYRN